MRSLSFRAMLSLQVWSCAVNQRVFAEAAPSADHPEASRLREKQLDLVGST